MMTTNNTITENQKELLSVLKKMFQLDRSDLDFGIYRIMNTKSEEIREFLDKDLISSVAKAFSSNNNNTIQKELDETIQQAQSLGADPQTLLNIDTFKSPFDYKLKIATSSVGETKDTNIDLIETFNYLLGLVVKRMELLKGYLVVEGQNLKKEKILIIWRNGQSSEELNKFFAKMDWSVFDREFDTIYVNGDNNLGNLRLDTDNFKVKLIEQEFKKLMFNE